VVSYAIIIYIVSHKFDQNLVQVGIYSIGLGLLNWQIARYFNFVTLMESIQNEPLGIAFLLSISAMVGLIIAVSIRMSKKIWATYQERKKTKKTEEEAQEKGYSKEETPTWSYFIEGRLEKAKKRFGKGYQITLRIHLRNSITPQRRYIDGILANTEEKRPYDILVLPKYVISARDRNEIIERLSNPLLIELNRNKVYREELRSLVKRECATSKQMVEELKNLLESNDEVLFSTLQRIDFSRYSQNLAYKLKQNRDITVEAKYDGPLFIPADNISAVEILRYETYYAISFLENNIEKVIPKIYEASNSPLF
jgi:hypothetical protein